MPPHPHRHPRADFADPLLAVAPLVTRWIERLLARHDPPLTLGQYLALRAIARDGVAGSELARRTGVSGPAVSQLVAGLSDGGLIARGPHTDDRRRQALELSKTGDRALASAQKVLERALEDLLGELPHPE